MERAQQEHQPGDVRELYTYPIFAVEEAGTGALASVPDAADEMQVIMILSLILSCLDASLQGTKH